jgi:hypothetical protein
MRGLVKAREKRAGRGKLIRKHRMKSVSREGRLMRSGNGQYVGITRDILRQVGATPGMRYRVDVVGPHEVLVHFIDKPEVSRMTLDDVLAIAKRKKILSRDIASEDSALGREIL